MKLLLYCNKAKPYLYYNWNTDTYHTTNSLKDLRGDFGGSRVCSGEDRLCAYQSDGRILTNGHIMAECDFEVKEIKYEETSEECWYIYNSDYSNHNWEKETGLLIEEIDKYLNGKNGHAINIKNLHIFDKPKELSEYYTRINDKDRMNDFKGIDVIFPDVQIDEWLYECVSCKKLEKAPRNIQKIVLLNKETNKYEYAILISLKPEELCRILNGKQTIIVRKKVLKEMLK